ncbi:MAG: ABC transporter permease [Acidobacteria bacterium]|nr:ABC transporter permease [Acidobacteriota bacterium]
MDVDAPLVSFTLALVLATWSLLSIGFVIVPTARFAQPRGALILYPMIPLSGLFAPLDALPPALESLARLLPLTYAVFATPRHLDRRDLVGARRRRRRARHRLRPGHRRRLPRVPLGVTRDRRPRARDSTIHVCCGEWRESRSGSTKGSSAPQGSTPLNAGRQWTPS